MSNDERYITPAKARQILSVGPKKMCVKVNPWLAAKTRNPFYGQGRGKRYRLGAVQQYAREHCVIN